MPGILGQGTCKSLHFGRVFLFSLMSLKEEISLCVVGGGGGGCFFFFREISSEISKNEAFVKDQLGAFFQSWCCLLYLHWQKSLYI